MKFGSDIKNGIIEMYPIKTPIHGSVNWDYISSFKVLSEEFIEKFQDKVNWGCISRYQKLSEEFIEKFQDKVNWIYISQYQKLSESFIEKFQDKVYWSGIWVYKQLSESFIEKFKDRVDWRSISSFQKLSESFIEKHRREVCWGGISQYQKLSEEFIERHKHKVDWFKVSIYQKLSDKFIMKFIKKVNLYSICKFQKLGCELVKYILVKNRCNVYLDGIFRYQKLSERCIETHQDKFDSSFWNDISKYQKLSESFIEKFKDKVDWGYVSKYQKLSSEFRKKYNIEILSFNWQYKPVNFKLKYIKEHTDYEVVDDKYIIAYKGIRSDNYSYFNFQYKYEVGGTYEAHCDCNIDNESSFGLSAWGIEEAKKYCNEKIIKVKIAIKDVGCIVRRENKIRCFKFEVLEEVTNKE